MTEQQIRQLYPQAQTVQQNPNIKGEQARLRVDKFQLEGEPFTLQFFDSAGGLHEVNLMQKADDIVGCVPISVRWGHLEELLNQKYGKFSVRTAQKDDQRRVVWNTRNMIVSLAYFEFGDLCQGNAAFSLLILNLSPTLSITCDATNTPKQPLIEMRPVSLPRQPCRGLSLLAIWSQQMGWHISLYRLTPLKQTK